MRSPTIPLLRRLRLHHKHLFSNLQPPRCPLSTRHFLPPLPPPLHYLLHFVRSFHLPPLRLARTHLFLLFLLHFLFHPLFSRHRFRWLGLPVSTPFPPLRRLPLGNPRFPTSLPPRAPTLPHLHRIFPPVARISLPISQTLRLPPLRCHISLLRLITSPPPLPPSLPLIIRQHLRTQTLSFRPSSQVFRLP